MTTEEFKKKIYDAIDHLLKGQYTISACAFQNANNRLISIGWFKGESLITIAHISETPKFELFSYRIDLPYHFDIYDERLEAFATMHSSHTCNLGHFYENWSQVEKILQDFTVYLVKEFN